MIFRRAILILLLVAILPTAIDPSCVRYFMYSGGGINSLLSIDDDPYEEKSVVESDRPTEVLAATRIPSQIFVEPASVLDLLSPLIAALPAGDERRHVERAPDFLAPTLRTSYLRHSVLLI